MDETIRCATCYIEGRIGQDHSLEHRDELQVLIEQKLSSATLVFDVGEDILVNPQGTYGIIS